MFAYRPDSPNGQKTVNPFYEFDSRSISVVFISGYLQALELDTIKNEETLVGC